MKNFCIAGVVLASVLSVGCYNGKKAIPIAAHRSGCEKESVDVVRQNGNDVVLDVCGTYEDWQFNALNGWEYVAPSAEQPVVASADRDGDGVLDSVDACPGQAGVAGPDIATNGCPPPPDGDGDGIADADDACAMVAGVANDDAAKNGCPPDSDADGIIDTADACPETAGVANDDAAKNGCPPDQDGDGVVDASDACPETAGVASDDAAKNGCPESDAPEACQKYFEAVDACLAAESVAEEARTAIETGKKTTQDGWATAKEDPEAASKYGETCQAALDQLNANPACKAPE